ncbi:MAG: DUF4307 domain-containing protein [Rothia sp. (in: high G+C Gram-positive bacteria)]|nr:DUF4307 domain-containing protein [Rothia sp. (in: high G+C Gram-positive bacteria)]
MSTPDLAARYGRSQAKAPKPRSFWYGLTALGLLLALAFVLWIQQDQSRNPVGRDVGFTLTSSDEVSITFEVSKRPEDTAICILKALNTAGAPVGWKEVAIGPYTDPQGTGISVQSTQLRVLGPATTVTVDSCQLAS